MVPLFSISISLGTWKHSFKEDARKYKSTPVGPVLPIEPLLPFDPASVAASDKHVVVPTMKSVHIQGTRSNHGSRRGEVMHLASC